MGLLTRLYQKFTGWEFEMNMPAHIKKGVLIGAPHTSNFDFFVSLAFMFSRPYSFNYIIKQSWIDSPLGWIFKRTNGIGVDRKADNKDFVLGLQKEMIKRDQLFLVMSPEGTRSHVERWKTGFYRIATAAQLPIILGKADYQKKVLDANRVFWPTGDPSVDFVLLEEEYAKVQGKDPSKFNLKFR